MYLHCDGAAEYQDLKMADFTLNAFISETQSIIQD